ncbi:MAG: hypothetical protein H0U21_01785 [Acidimicrobiia bacterium]|nr:hypothetical protein [Acidimicrobiia bacterium]
MLEVVALVFAPVLGFVGVFVGYLLNSRREDRVLRRELALEQYRAGQGLFEEIISSAGTRFTAMQRWLWSVADPEPYRAVPARADYFKLLQGWNAACWSRRARLRLMLGDDTALRFLDYRDDNRQAPLSLHYQSSPLIEPSSEPSETGRSLPLLSIASMASITRGQTSQTTSP